MSDPPYGKPAIPAGLKNLTGPEKGLHLFFELVEGIRSEQENIEDLFIEVNKKLSELDRRLTAFEIMMDRDRSRLLQLEGGSPVRMECITCCNYFDIPAEEAEKLKYIAICPECKNFALSPSAPDINNVAGYSIQHVANELNLNIWQVYARARELGLKGYNYRFSKEEIQKIKQLQSNKKRGRPRK